MRRAPATDGTDAPSERPPVGAERRTGGQDRIIAAMLLVYGLANGALLAYMATVVPLPAGFLAASVALAGAGIVAGAGSLRGLRWARILSALFFLVQVAHAALPTLGASLVLGIHFTVSVTGTQGEPIGIDPIAVTLLAWSLVRLALERARQPVRL